MNIFFGGGKFSVAESRLQSWTVIYLYQSEFNTSNKYVFISFSIFKKYLFYEFILLLPLTVALTQQNDNFTISWVLETLLVFVH